MAALPRCAALLLALKLCGYFTGSAAATGRKHPPHVFGFHPAFGSTMVLQREPAAAQIYGILGNLTQARSTPVVTVTVTDTMATHGGEVSYSVDAEVYPGGTWKALLKPALAGGSFTIAAECKGCTVTTAASLHDVTFGDVWYAANKHTCQVLRITFVESPFILSVSFGSPFCFDIIAQVLCGPVKQ